MRVSQQAKVVNDFFLYAEDVLAAFDRDGIVQVVSPSVQRVLGFAPEELVGRHFREFVHPDDQGESDVEFWNLIAGGHDSLRFVVRCRTRDGEYRRLQCSTRAPQSDHQFVYAVCRDVTDDPETADGWKSRYETAAAFTGRVFYEWNTADDTLTWGASCETVLGYPPTDMPARMDEWLELVHPEDRRAAKSQLQSQSWLDTGASLQLEYRIRRHDDQYILVRHDGRSIGGRDGRSEILLGFITDLTQLKWSEHRFRAFIERAPLCVLVVESDGSIRFANERAAQMFGYARDALPGRKIEELIPERWRPGHPEKRDRFFRTPSEISLAGRELYGLRGDGTEFPLEVGVSPLETPTGILAICTVNDVSDRAAARQAADDQQRLLLEILNNTSAVVYMKNADLRYEFVNQRWIDLFHHTMQQTIGKDDFKLFPAELAKNFRRNDRQVLERGVPLQIEEVAPHDDGLHSYVSLKFPLRDAAGLVRGLAGISTDITELIQARHDLKNLTSQLELILNSTTDGIYGLDREGNTTFVNRAAEQLLGWSAADLLGRRHHDLSHHTTADGVPYAIEDCPIYRVILSGESTHVAEDVFWRHDGTPLPVEYTASPLIDQDGIVGAVVTFRDITERLRQREREHEMASAHAVQQRLYPKKSPELLGFDIAGAAFPAAQASGDYYDFIPYRDGVVLALGDVSGHGLGAALQMMQMRAFLRSLLETDDNLERVVIELNRLLLRDTPTACFVTLFLVYLQSDRSAFQFIGAGHHATVLRSDGTVETLESTGFPLGVRSDCQIRMSPEQMLNSGDLLCMMTDGVHETFSPQMELFGQQRTYEIIQDNRHLSCREIVNRLYAAAREFARTTTQEDDITILLAKCCGP